ncbi:hypothetical protein FB446DRAFT_772181 [Lentinula raphanica]|nr:hypothetical protein FB446DRAFT_772181 [Lentinula raphanica]
MFTSVRSLVPLAIMAAAASSVAATPVKVWARSDVLTTFTSNFTLAAFNTTLPNANLTGAPLVLGSGGAIDGESFQVTSTYASYPLDEYPSLGLVGGNLRAFLSDGGWFTNATAPLSGNALGWVTSSFYSDPASTAFSAIWIDDTQPYAILAVNGISNLWSLCPSDAPRAGQDTLYFNATTIPSQSGVSGASPIECYPVKVNMVPV